MAYTTIKHFTKVEDFDQVSGRVTTKIDTLEDFGVIDLSFEFFTEGRIKEGEGAYGPWRLIGNIDVKSSDLNLQDKGLFQNTDFNDRTKFEDGATFKLGDGKFLKIYPSKKEVNTYAIYYKSKNEEPKNQDLPF